jgi:hypothetical protein
MKVKMYVLLAVLTVAIGFAPSSFGSTIQLGINGDAQFGSNYVDFGNYPTGTLYTPAPGYGTFEVSFLGSGIFQSNGVTTGETGAIQSLNGGTGSVTLPGAFMTFSTGGSNLQFWATNIPAGTVGPFVFTNTPDGAVASFDVQGYVLNTTTLSQTDFTATFSATFDGETTAQLLGGLPVNTPFSATFTATTDSPGPAPEPSSVLLTSTGILCLGFTWAKKRLAILR